MTDTGQRMDLRTSAAEAVTNQLRRELLDGTIAAGARMMPKDLAARFAVSIVPVREALRRLESEGLVVTSPQRATFAADVGLEDLAGVYDLRRIVEPELAERAVAAATDDDRSKCRIAINALLEAKPFSSEFFDAHRAFHWQLIAPAASPVARRILVRLWQSVDRYIAHAAKNLPEVSGADYIKSFHEEHATLASAFEAGDGPHLRSLLVTHLTSTESSLKHAYQVLAPELPATSHWLGEV
jgi:DNA-binding GntR family transcriptional regulator